MTNLNEITYIDWQYKLNKIGSVAEGVEDINQCIAIILLTQKGSDPLRPTFGSDIYKYIDYPINSATLTSHYIFLHLIFWLVYSYAHCTINTLISILNKIKYFFNR